MKQSQDLNLDVLNLRAWNLHLLYSDQLLIILGPWLLRNIGIISGSQLLIVAEPTTY